jgi:hypothetical protein
MTGADQRPRGSVTGRPGRPSPRTPDHRVGSQGWMITRVDADAGEVPTSVE